MTQHMSKQPGSADVTPQAAPVNERPRFCQGCGAPIPSSRRGTPRKWCSQRCRKRQYDRECIDCGSRVDGTTPGRAGGRCGPCATEARRRWTPETVIAAIQHFTEERGGIPPTASEWRWHIVGDEKWPTTSTVQEMFDGSWNAAIRAAGFDPRAIGHYGRDGESPEFCRMLADRYEAGADVRALADEFDCHPDTIYKRLRRVGAVMRRSGPRATAARSLTAPSVTPGQNQDFTETSTSTTGSHAVDPVNKGQTR